ncbi:hypothetical protein [Flavobacterium sp. XGLA_31]|uniref:hypothetical protein n=1 Tax=Flavobacterium sp. XGLA_31 TaxID=3447666 RepID=UPI003F2A01F0
MAQINKHKALSGVIGNLVFRTMAKKQIVQSKPDSVQQTSKTRISGSEFRQCSSWAKRLRLGLTSFLSHDTDSYMHSRFTGQLYAALQLNTALPKGVRTPLNSSMVGLAGFEFNTHSPFTDYFTPDINAVLNDQNQVVVTIPAFHPKTAVHFAEETQQAELLLYVLSTNFDRHTHYEDAYTLLPIAYQEALIPETVWTGPVMPQGHLVLVCAKLLFYHTNRFTEKQYVNSKNCSPARIIAAES